jgi:hypothetical protein
MSRIVQGETAPEILAHFLAQNSADYARMMPFDASVWPVKRAKQTNTTPDGTVMSPLL